MQYLENIISPSEFTVSRTHDTVAVLHIRGAGFKP